MASGQTRSLRRRLAIALLAALALVAAAASALVFYARGRLAGARDPQLRITKQGDPFVRRLLVQCARYILGPFGKDCALRRYGLRIAERGGKHAKKRAAVAVARKLAVLLHRLWLTAEVYEPLYHLDEEHHRAA